MKTRKKKNRIRDKSLKKLINKQNKHQKHKTKPQQVQTDQKKQKKSQIQNNKDLKEKIQDIQINTKKEILPFSELLDFQNIKRYYGSAELPNYTQLLELNKSKKYLKCGFKIFPLVNQNDLKQIHCIYSRNLLLEDDKQYHRFNREHSFPLYYVKYPNKQFLNDLIHIFPAQQKANYQRANRYYYCPTLQVCQCLQQKEKLVNIGDLYRDSKKYDVFDMLEEYLYGIYNEYFQQEFKKCLPQNKQKKKVLVQKDEFGYIYTGDPGFYCPKNNIGPLARACLYSLLFYKDLFVKEKIDKIDIQYLKYKAQTEKVQKWEKERNHKIYYVQDNRNPFVDFPELAKNFNF